MLTPVCPPPLQVEYMARLVEEAELEEADKKEGVKGMLEAFVTASAGVGKTSRARAETVPDLQESTEADQVDRLIDDVVAHWTELAVQQAQQAQEEADNEDDDESGSDDDDKPTKGGSPRGACQNGLDRR